ncbi:hypothetical protein EVJ58_g4025 [Rhodofomes roseus]|uniref:Uncharacterized protein n=1 Tax=Rhodofomes roseus TaxID=34475 RepID=A0A4Y9YI09_9APHY|nr:hypothetical protein EVJ58_g4025 [Rhodofomes roseus]
MTSTASNEPIADRDSIHKSCKTLETVVNVLNDYCEAANAILILQRKLVKALRDAAAVKCVPEIPANALSVSATIFDTLCEVDAKFVKLADKECDAISAEIKKWFKKLAKEERAYDDRLANANAKIKQAGQSYEKKAKRNPQDAADEHARYMHILTTLGPEINQEKFNHSLMVTRRHNATIHNLAAGLSRVADAEWLRSCEGVRRSAPTIGQLGEWRVYCEGGWSGPLPADLPNGDVPPYRSERSVTPVAQGRTVTPNPEKPPLGPGTPMLEKPAPEYSSRRPSEQETDASSRAVTPTHDPSPAPPQYRPPPDQPAEAKLASPPPLKTIADDSVRSLASLSSFPAPPTHFPMPPLGKAEASSPVKETRPESPRGPRTPSEILFFQRKTESPAPLTPSETPRPLPSPAVPHAEPAAVTSTRSVDSNGRVEGAQEPSDSQHSPRSDAHELHERRAAKTPSPVLTRASSKKLNIENSGASSGPTSSIAGSSQSDHIDDGEFGALRTMDEQRIWQGRPADAPSSQQVERSDTGASNVSVVAALRDRYSRIPEQPTSPRKEVPKLPTNVSKIANRYQSNDTSPTSPRLPPPSPTGDRRRLSMDVPRNSTQPFPTDRRTSGVTSTSYATNTMTSIPMSDDIALRRQRIAELEDLEIREQELELRRKEREIEQRAKVLEEERARILNARRPDSGYGSDAARSGMTDRLSMSQQSDAYSTSSARPRYTQHSYSSAALDQPRPARPSSSQPASPLYQPASDHAPYCGCETCSASKYTSRDTSPSPIHVRPIQLRPEKPKGWIRRLSMPVMGNAFSLDSKKGISSAGIAGGPGFRSSLALPEEDGVIRRDVTGGVRNRSATNLARR